MLKLNFALIAQQVTLDDQKLATPNRVIETLVSDGPFPISLPPCTLLLMWQRSDPNDLSEERQSTQFTLHSPDAKAPLTLMSKPVEVIIPEGQYTSKSTIPLEGLPIYGHGEVRVVISAEMNGSWKDVGEASIITIGKS